MHSLYGFSSLVLVILLTGECIKCDKNSGHIDCTNIMKMPNGSFEIEPIYPLLTKENLDYDCRPEKLGSYKDCLYLSKSIESIDLTESFVFLKFLNSICQEFKDVYVNSSDCVHKCKSSKEINACPQIQMTEEYGPGEICNSINRRIECVANVVGRCGSSAAEMTRSLMGTIFYTATDINGINCSNQTYTSSQSPSNETPPSTSHIENQDSSSQVPLTTFMPESTTHNGSSKIGTPNFLAIVYLLVFLIRIH